MRQALVLVDLQNDFLAEEGYAPMPRVQDLMRNVARLVAHARARELPVVWVHSVYGEWEGDAPPGPVYCEGEKGGNAPRNTARLAGTHGKRNCCTRGSKGSRFSKAAKKLQRGGDLFVEKTFFSAFTRTRLCEVLREELRVEQLLLGGVATSTCVRATACDARALGFDVVLVSDCTRSKTADMQWRHASYIAEHYASRVLTSYELEPDERAPLHVVNDTHLAYGVCRETNVYARLLQEVKWEEMQSRGSPVPRLVALQGEVSDEGDTPVYRHPADRQPPLAPWSPTVERLRAFLVEKLQFEPNHVLIQLYRDSTDNIGEHSDKTLDVVPGSRIVNFSFGATRVMTLKSKLKGADGKHRYHRVPLPSGSVFSLDLETNKEYFHAIRSDKRPLSVKADHELLEDCGRISLTFRRVATFLTPEYQLWGQGAARKTRDNLGPDLRLQATSERIAEQQLMLYAFSAENQAGREFDWDAHYARGFECLDLQELNEDPLRFEAREGVVSLFYVNGSISSWRVLLFLHEARVPFEAKRMRVMRRPKDTKDAQFLRLNPRGKCPTLVDADGTVIYESLAILLYLQAKYPQVLQDRSARVLQRMHEVPNVEKAYGPVEKMFHQHELTSEEVQKARKAPAKILRELQLWERYAEEGDYIAGTADMTLADCAFFPALEYMVHRGLELHPKRFASLCAYRARMKERASAPLARPEGWKEVGVDLFKRLQLAEGT